jgi:hypothetical protein
MTVLMIAGALIALLLGTATVLLLRTFLTTCMSYVQSFDRADLSWSDYGHFKRLLDPADFEFLRRRGVAEEKIKKLRRERRQIYKLCLRSLAADYNRVQQALNMVLVQSETDRPDLAAMIARQKVQFYRSLMIAEASLILHACGVDRIPSVDLVRPFVALQEQLQQLSLSPAMAGSAA